MSRAARLALVVFVAAMGFNLPRPPFGVPAVWADLALLAALVITTIAIAAGHLRWSRSGVLALGAYTAWVVASCVISSQPVLARVGAALGVVALAGLCSIVTSWSRAEHAPFRDALVRAWVWGAVALGLVGLCSGIAAQAGVDILPLYRGDGELRLAFRPAGLQRVGLLAELCLVPFLVVFYDGKRLLGAKLRWVALAILAVVLLAGLTRTLIAVAVGLAILKVHRMWLRKLILAVLVLAAFAAFRVDVHGGSEPGIRWRIAAETLHTIRAHAAFGIGPEGTVATVGWPHAADPPQGWDAHLTWLDVCARHGIPAGAGLFFVFFLMVRRRAIDAADTDDLGVALSAGLWATLFDSFQVDVEQFRHVWLLLGLCAGYDPLRSSRSSLASTRARPALFTSSVSASSAK